MAFKPKGKESIVQILKRIGNNIYETYAFVASVASAGGIAYHKIRTDYEVASGKKSATEAMKENAHVVGEATSTIYKHGNRMGKIANTEGSTCEEIGKNYSAVNKVARFMDADQSATMKNYVDDSVKATQNKLAPEAKSLGQSIQIAHHEVLKQSHGAPINLAPAFEN